MPSFRLLYHRLIEQMSSGDPHVYPTVLQPWVAHAQEALVALARYATLETLSWGPDQVDPCSGGARGYYTCREHLYALSRVSDLLLLPFEPNWDPAAPYVWTQQEPNITLEERSAWWRALGMTEITHPIFHPFYHEIVAVEQAEDPDEPFHLLETRWPGFLFGRLLFCRAGVKVQVGAHHAQQALAERSRLYFAFARNNRPPRDDSHGWGHDSQWGTNFRRDYLTDVAYRYNVDGAHDVNEAITEAAEAAVTFPDERRGAPLTDAAWIELVTHRCFVVTPERFYDEYLSDVRYDESRLPLGDVGGAV